MDKDNVQVHVIVHVDADIVVGANVHFLHVHVYAYVHVHFDVDRIWMLKMFTLLMVVVDANVEVSVRVRSKATMTMLKQEWCKGVEKRRGCRHYRKRRRNMAWPRSSRNRSEQVAVARMQHRAGAVGRSEARQARIVAPRVFGCVGSCIAVAVSISAFVSRAMSFRRRPVPSVFFFTTHSSLDQDRRRTNPIAPTTITEMSERESTKLIEVETERKEEKAMVCGDAVHVITCVAGKEALRRFRHDGFFGRVFHRQRVGSFLFHR